MASPRRGQSRTWPLTPWPKINRGPPLIIHNLHWKVWKWLGKTVVAIVSTRSYIQSVKVDLDIWPQINRVLPLIIHNLHVKFEKDWARTVAAIVSTTYTQSAKVDLDLLTPWPKINRVHPLIIHNLHMKFESDWAKTVVAIVSTTSYIQSATVNLDLWPVTQNQ